MLHCATIKQIEKKISEQKVNEEQTQIDNENMLTENQTILENQPKEEKKKWNDLAEEDKKQYIEKAIRTIYENQLKDESFEMTRQQRALKKDCLENNEFFIEDLSDEEKTETFKLAQEIYENDKPEVNKDKIKDDKNNNKKDNFISKIPLNAIKSILLILVRGFIGGVKLQAQISNEDGFYTVYFNKDGLTLRHLTKVCKLREIMLLVAN